MTKLLGVELSRDEVLAALRRLGFRYAVDGDTLVATPPPWRTDVVIPEDVIEEAARLVGYERIPTRLPSGPLPLPEPHPLEQFREAMREALVGLGLQEVVSYPLVDPSWLDDERPVTVTNPLSRELSVLRTTLLPSLLDTARRNLAWTAGVVLFEIGKRYVPRPADLPEERWTVGILLAGRDAPDDAPRHWSDGEARPFDYFDAIAAIDGLASALQLSLPELEPGAPGLHAGRSAWARVNDLQLLRVGQLTPEAAARWEVPPETVVAEIDLALLLERRVPPAAATPPRYPSAYRDVAVAVDEDLPWARVRDEARSAAGKALTGLALLDLYRGPQAGEGKKSLAMRLTFQSEQGTLAEEEIERLVRRVTARLQRTFGATLRA
jgi:phenylalanyl-tRNA synthetase beta chain